MKPVAPRIALYSPDSYGLGHFRRSRRIAAALAESFPGASVLLLTGCLVADRFSAVANVDLVRLPAVTKDAAGSYASRSLGIDRESLKRLRSSILDASVAAFEPDVFIADHAPGGLAGELLPVLERLRRSPRPALVALGLRDIIDAPRVVRAQWLRDGIYELLDWAYDEVWVYGRAEVFDAVAEYAVPASLGHRFQHVGYILEAPPAPRRRQGSRRVPFVVAAGGGGEDAFPLLSAVIAARAMSERRFRLTVFPGPLMSHHDRHELEKAAQAIGADAVVHPFTEKTQQIAADADALVTMGGYNSMLESIVTGIPSLVVPRIWPRVEQLLRAERMSAAGWTRYLRPDGLQPEALLAEILGLLDGRRPAPFPAAHLGGLQRIVERCAQALRAVPDEVAPAVEIAVSPGLV